MSPFPRHLFRRHANRSNADSSANNDGETTDPAEAAVVTIDMESSANNDNNTNNNNDDDNASTSSEDNILLVPIPPTTRLHTQRTSIFFPRNNNPSPHRRSAILAEVQRVQRANFIHFALLCLVPTSLLLIVIAAIVSEDGECGDGDTTAADDGSVLEGVVCEREGRTFANAFTTRCVCQAVRSVVVVGDVNADIGTDGEQGDDGGLF